MSVLPAVNLETTLLDVELEQARTGRRKPALTLVKQARSQPNKTLHKGVFKALAGVNVFILSVFAWVFRGDGDALFMVAVSAAYLLAYMGTPYAMARIGGFHRRAEKPLSAFLDQPFETWTGVIKGREAALQILLVPCAIAIATLGMGIIIAFNQ